MKSKFNKKPNASETRDSRRQRCRLYPALAMTASASVFVLASNLAVASDVFLTYPCGTETFTFACFQINVNPNFTWLLNPGNLPSIDDQPYPGWSSPNLTSPGMQDAPSYPGQTIIGESMGLPAPPRLSTYSTLYPGGVQIGDTGCVVSNQVVSLYDYIILGSGPSSVASYAYPFLGWQYPPPSTPTSPNPALLTELQYFTLTSNNGKSTGQSCPPGTSSLYPANTSGQDILLKAGYQNLADPARRSIGMIVSHNSAPVGSTLNFPAESFFDVFVEVTLPTISGTVSGSGSSGSPIFPAGGALLINDSAHPLIVSTDPLTGYPSYSNPILYLHSPATPAVPLLFEYDNPNPNYPADSSGKPYWWHKGDTFGWIQLAGHGVFNPCAKSTVNWDLFMRSVLGDVAHAKPSAPMGGVVPTSNYPFPTCTYSMEQGTNLGGLPWDAITFTNTTSISAAYLTLTNFPMPVALPAYGSSVTYTNTNTVANISWSLDSLTGYVPTQSTGTVVVQITYTNTPVNGVATYNTTLLECSFSGLADFGQWALQLDNTKPNVGLHMVEALGQGGYRVTGFFDALFQVSANGGISWTDSDAHSRLYLGGSPCGASIEPIHSTLSGTNVIIDWANPSYSLEGSTSLNPATWVAIPGGSPAILPANTPYKFFRLTCD